MTKPIHRLVYRAQCRPGQEGATAAAWRARSADLHGQRENRQLHTASIFRWGGHFFLYYETTDAALMPDHLAGPMDSLLES